MIYDLHSHSTASDGALSPSALVLKAIESGINVLAITDHDTVNGVVEAKICAEKQPITIVSGVEISCRWEQKVDVHVVGLGIDHSDNLFLQRLDTQKDKRKERAQKMLVKLSKLGIEGGEAWFAEHGLVTPGRPHFAKFLIDKGIVKNDSEAFKKYLGIGKLIYVPTEWCPIETAVKWISEAGGVAVLAHPGKYKMTHSKLRRMATAFRQAGGHGIEVVSGNIDRESVNKMARLADELDLKASTGSDFHRPGDVWQALGKFAPLPSNCTSVWQAWPALFKCG